MAQLRGRRSASNTSKLWRMAGRSELYKLSSREATIEGRCCMGNPELYAQPTHPISYRGDAQESRRCFYTPVRPNPDTQNMNRFCQPKYPEHESMLRVASHTSKSWRMAGRSELYKSSSREATIAERSWVWLKARIPERSNPLSLSPPL